MIPLFRTNVSPDAASKVAEVLASGMLGEGPKVAQFTDELRKLFGNKNVVALNSCTSALTLALRLANVKPHHRVICSPFTMAATSCAIKTATELISWTNVDKRTLCMDTQHAISLMGTDIGAVIVTAVGGLLPHGMEDLISASRQRGIPIVIDAAHALTTTYKGKHISHWGDFVCFSFQSIKHLTTGDGGALTYKDDWMEDRVERLKWFGMSRKVPEGKTKVEHQMEYSIPEWGYKFHMNDVAAAIGLANLGVAQRAVEASKKNAKRYHSVLECPLELPEGLDPSWWVYGFNTSSEYIQKEVINKFTKEGIEATPMWRMNHLHKYSNSKPSHWEYGTHPVFIPSGFWLTEEQVHQVAVVCGMRD